MDKNRLQERIARKFLVNPNETRVVLYYLILFVFLGVGVALGRGSADALFFKRYGIEHLPVVYVLSALALAVSCTLYAAFADRLSSERFLKYILAILSVLLFAVWALMNMPDVDWAYPLYYVLYEVASELVLIHAGLYLNQNLDALQSKRLVPLIFGGSQVGIILGGVLLAVLSPIIGVGNIVLLWILASLISIAMVVYWHSHRGVSPYYKAGRKRRLTVGDSLTELFQGLQFMRQSDLLRMASLSLFFMVIMFYVLIYSVNQVYTETFETEDSLSSFFGVLVAVNSFIALVLQFFVANRILRKLGVKTVNLFFPATSIVSYLMLLVSFALPSALVASFNKDVVMTAFRNPVWNLMMNALPGNIQGRARAITVALVIPLALLLAGLILYVLKQFENSAYIAIAGLISATLYLYFSRRMNNVYVSEIVSHLKQKLSLPDDTATIALRGGDDQVLEDLAQGIQHPDDQIFLAYAQSMIKSFPEQATGIILARLPGASNKVQDKVIRLLLPLKSELLPPALWSLVVDGDERLQSTCYSALIKLNDATVRERIPELLSHEQARFKVVGVLGAYHFQLRAIISKARVVWQQLLKSDEALDNQFGLELFQMADQLGIEHDMYGEDLRHAAGNMIAGGDVRGCRESLKMSPYLLKQDQEWFLQQLSKLSGHVDSKVRVDCQKGWMLLDCNSAAHGIEPFLEDPHPEVRVLAAKLLGELALYDERRMTGRISGEASGSPRAQSAVLETLLSGNPSQITMLELAIAKVEDVQRFNEAVRIISQAADDRGNTAMKVLAIVLDEHLHASIDLTLQALQGNEDASDINAIRMGMKSHEAQFRATACEAIQGLGNKQIGRILTTIIESPEHIKSRYFSNVEQVLEWCKKKNDPWLSECASAAGAAL